MPLDPSIILRAGQGTQGPSLNELVQLKQLSSKIKADKRAQEGEAALGSLYASNVKEDGTLDTAAVTRGLGEQGFGTQIPGVLEQGQKLQKGRTENEAAELDLQKQRVGIISQQLGSLLADPELNYDKVINRISFLVDKKVINQEEGAGMVKQLPGPQQLRPFLISKALETETALKQLEATSPKIDKQDLGGQISVGTVDPLTGKRTEVERLDKTASPGEKLTDERLKNRAVQTGLSQSAIDLAARRLLNGEPANRVLANFGRGAQGAREIAAVQNRFAELAEGGGIDAGEIGLRNQELASEARTRLELGAREGKIAARVEEAKQFAEIAKTASQAVARTQFVPYNKLKQLSDSQINSDPNLAKFRAANLSLINAYAAAIGGGTPTVRDKEEADKILQTAQSAEAYEAVVDQLIVETEAALASPRKVMEDLREDSTRRNKERDPGDIPTDIQNIFSTYGVE